MFIIDNTDIKVLARLHLSRLTSSEQLVAVLDETTKWQDNWSHQILQVDHKFDHDLHYCCKYEAARFKAWEKQHEQEKDQAKFNKVSNENAECI
jgi:hypothetical protein